MISSLAQAPKGVDQGQPSEKVNESLTAENYQLMEEIDKKD